MNGPGMAVTPEALSAAATTIAEAVGDVRRPPVVGPRGEAYGHDGVGAAVAEFGAVLRLAIDALVGAALGAASGLRAGAGGYTAAEQRNVAGLVGLDASRGGP